MNATASSSSAPPAAMLGGAVAQPQGLVGQPPAAAGSVGDFALTLAALPQDAMADPAPASTPVSAALPTELPEPAATTQASAQSAAEAAQDSSDELPAVEMVDVYALAALGLLPMQNPLPQALSDKPARNFLPSQATPLAMLPEPEAGSRALAPAALVPPVPPVATAAGAASTTSAAEPASVELQQLIERLSAQPADGDAAPLVAELGTTLRSGAAALDAEPPVLALKGEPRQWQQPLMQALGDRLQLQIASRSEQAVIRLDPPMLGQVEIAIRQQAGELQVRLSASHGEVARQLHQVSDNLRQDLVQRHSGEVTVLVTQGTRAADETRSAGRDPQSQQQQQQHAQDQREQQQQRRPGRGLSEEGAASFGFASPLSATETPV